MEKYPCSCGGENPNCYRCDGTGMVETPTLPLRSDGRIHPRDDGYEVGKKTVPAEKNQATMPLVKVQNETKNWVCPKCKTTYFSTVDYLLHIRQIHPKPVPLTKPANGKNKSPKPTGDGYSTCELCDVKAINMKRHYAKVHDHLAAARREERKARKAKVLESRLQALKQQQKKSEHIRQKLAEVRRIYPDARICGVCAEMHKTQPELLDHLQKAHGLSAKRTDNTSAKIHRLPNKPTATREAGTNQDQKHMRKLSSSAQRAGNLFLPVET